MTRYLKQYKFLLFLTVLFTAISSLSYVFIAILLQQVMDIVDIGDMDGFIRIMLFSLAYFALMGLFMYLQSLFSKKFICKIMKAVRSKTFMGIERHTIEDYTKNHTADYLSAITNDVKMIEDNFLLSLLQVIQYTIIFIASLAVMIYFDIIVTVCVIIAIAIMLIVPSLFGGLLSERQDKYSDMLSIFTNHVKDLLSGFEVIKSYRMKKYVLSRFETSNEDTIKAKYSVDKAIAANEAVSMVLALLVQVVVVFLSAYFIIIGRISAGALLGMVQVSSNLANPLLIIFSNIPKIKSIKPIAHKLNQLSDYKSQGANTKNSPAFNNVICVENLHFSYDICTGDYIVFEAKCVVLATGGFQPHTLKNTISEMSGDGMAMALRAGDGLTEMLAHGYRAGLEAAAFAAGAGRPGNLSAQAEKIVAELESVFERPAGETRVPILAARLRSLADSGLNVVRDEQKIRCALDGVREIRRELGQVGIASKSRRYNLDYLGWLELRNLSVLTEAALLAAGQRRESRGSHIRADYPGVDNHNYLCRLTAKLENGRLAQGRIRPRAGRLPLPDRDYNSVADCLADIL